jgi:ATP-dependent helicase Lhr and Lhr-like helicase
VSAFDRLSPALQYQITQTLGISELRPVQEVTIPHVLDGKNCVVLAPTAGGKTEAAFFPVLSRVDAEDLRPVSVIYTSPIRALLNNQEERVSRYAATIGRRVFKWHGDVGPTHRRRFLDHPTDILMTTPESLEAMLMSTRVPARRLFEGLEVVIVDEVHAFADDDRGAHLSALLERLSRYCGRDVQRIGLSATVGNPDEILEWLRGRSKREGVVISPPRPPVSPLLSLDYVGSVANAAIVAEQLHRGQKRLIFVDSRRGVEEFGNELTARGVSTFLAHGSLSVTARRDAERAFAEGSDCAIVATSALELGIDVGDLDHVLQIDCPGTVASFLQRMGRTGRRAGAVPNCTFLATKESAVLQAAALLRLHRSGFVESVHPSRRASHMLAHQLMALTVQEQGVPVSDWWGWLEGATPFLGLTAAERQSVVEHMLTEEILVAADGRLALGPRGERLYGRRHFAELYAVFSVPRAIIVWVGEQELGTVGASFLQGAEPGSRNSTFVLGGRAWELIQVDWSKGRCSVKPAEGGAKAARWFGGPGALSYELCQAMRDVLTSDDADASWSKRAVEVIARLREEHAFLRDGERAPMVSESDGIAWWTFAGARANQLLARVIEGELGGRCVVRDTSISCRDEAGSSVAALRDLVRRLLEQHRPGAEDARRFATPTGRARLSKFEACLPETLLADLAGERAVDVAGARAVLSA